MKPTFFKTPASFRGWLAKNHDSCRELLVGFYKKQSGRGGITYPQALDEALCFGWIDGVRRRLDDESYTIRFTPRNARSTWSVVNIARARELIKLGVMQPPGMTAYESRDEEKSKRYSYEARSRPLDAAYEKRFRADRKAWAFFSAQPAGYRRTASWYVMSAVKEETRQRRLDDLIARSANERRLGIVTGSSKSGATRG